MANSKLTDRQVAVAVAELRPRGRGRPAGVRNGYGTRGTSRALARRFGVSHTTVLRAVRAAAEAADRTEPEAEG